VRLSQREPLAPPRIFRPIRPIDRHKHTSTHPFRKHTLALATMAMQRPPAVEPTSSCPASVFKPLGFAYNKLVPPPPPPIGPFYLITMASLGKQSRTNTITADKS
jgi:hypothetical protein